MAAPLTGIEGGVSFGDGRGTSDVGAWRSLGVDASGRKSSCFTPRHLTCLAPVSPSQPQAPSAHSIALLSIFLLN
jgi:hypothetical protein